MNFRAYRKDCFPGALGFFSVRASYRQIQPQYHKTRLAVLAGGVIYIATAGVLHLLLILTSGFAVLP